MCIFSTSHLYQFHLSNWPHYSQQRLHLQGMVAHYRSRPGTYDQEESPKYVDQLKKKLVSSTDTKKNQEKREKLEEKNPEKPRKTKKN